METQEKISITIQATINAPVEIVWNYWNDPEVVKQWNNASPDWHTPKAENDLRAGGQFVYTMAAKDGSFSFDFGGTYDKVEEHLLIEYTMGDGRKAIVRFEDKDDTTEIVETFDAENQNPIEMQRAGWQAILDNFKKYCEEN